MTTLSDKDFKNKYFRTVVDKGDEKEKLQDNFQTQNKKLFPFTQNLSTNLYDGKCGLNGVAAEFFRKITNSNVTPIYSSEKAKLILKKALKEKYHMSDDEIGRFLLVFDDILFDNGVLNVIDTSFYSFVPMKFYDESLDETKKKYPKENNYRSGQIKIANYYVSMAEFFNKSLISNSKDLFSQVVCDCLQQTKDVFERNESESYYILPFVKRQCAKDLTWLMSQRKDAIVKFLPLFLHFYICFSLIQILIFMNEKNWCIDITKPKEVYFILSSEKVSMMSDCVRRGWSAPDCLPETFLNRLSAYAQALDILNCLFEEEEFMTFQEILAKFKEMDFNESAKCLCEGVLLEYRERKNLTLSDRKTEKNFIPDKSDININSFNDFVNKLLKLCIKLQSKDYNRLKRPIHDLFKIKLRVQRRDYKVLALDDDTLLFLIAMAVGYDKRIRMEELYSRLKIRYGIVFSFYTRNSIADYLQKLNLLERKSDSGEAQYVHIVL